MSVPGRPGATEMGVLSAGTGAVTRKAAVTNGAKKSTAEL
jgi:hypothetical protein